MQQDLLSLITIFQSILGALLIWNWSGGAWDWLGAAGRGGGSCTAAFNQSKS